MQIVSSGDNLHEISKPVFWEKLEENRFRHFMQIVSSGDSLHEMSKPVFCEK